MITDIQSIAIQFENKTLPKEKWTHHAHIAVAFVLLDRYKDFDHTLNFLREAIKSYNLSIGGQNTDHSGYHETLTVFWLRVVNEFLQFKHDKPLEEVYNDFIHSELAQVDFTMLFYSQAWLFSVVARKNWVEPDTLPLLTLKEKIINVVMQKRSDENQSFPQQDLPLVFAQMKEHIRKRPTMYLGRLHLSGFLQMLEYVFDEILADALAKPVFEISFLQGNRVAMHLRSIDISRFLLRLEKLTNNLGLGVLIALSEEILLEAHTLEKVWVLRGQKGDIELQTLPSQARNHQLLISFTIDTEIFNELRLVYEVIIDFFRQFAFLNPQLTLISLDKTTDEFQRNIFHYPRGIFRQLDDFIAQKCHSMPLFRVDIAAEIRNYTYKIAISDADAWFEPHFIKTYAGNLETRLGGSLQEGILDGLIFAIRQVAEKEKVTIILNRKRLKECLTIIAAVRGEGFNFEGCTREKLGTPEIRKTAKKLVSEQVRLYFEANPIAAKRMLLKFKHQSS